MTNQQSTIKPIIIAALLALPVVVTGCGESNGNKLNNGKPNVACTTTMIADLAHQIGGEHINVQGIMKPGQDPHIYKVLPRDGNLIAEADLVLMNGLHLEATLDAVIKNNANGKIARLAESGKIKPMGSADEEGAPDPHCWFNVEYFKVYAEGTRDALIAIDAVHADDYRKNTEAYIKQLDELHIWVKEQIATIPKEQRVMITSHDAFQYYGAAYDIEVHGVIGISTEQQPRPGDLQSLETQIKERKVKALFIETSVSEALNDIVRKAAKNTGAKIGGTLFSDSLGDKDSAGATYLDMIRYNTKTIAEALK